MPQLESQEDLSKQSDNDFKNQGKQNESDLDHKKKVSFLDNLGQSSQINDIVIQEQNVYKMQDFSKQKDILEQINEYNFKAYQNEQYKYLDYDKKQIHNSNVRQWSKKLFEIENQKLVFNKQILSQQKWILKILKNKQYYLCKCFESNENRTIFIGYKQQPNGCYEDYIFIIKQKPTESEINEYNIIREFKEEVNLFIIPINQIHIFILKRDVYIQYYNIFSKLKPMIEWSNEQFNQMNDKILNQKNCNQCNGCKHGQKCNYYFIFQEFKQNQDLILRKLYEKQYCLTKYLNKGGCGLIFEGYKHSFFEYQELAFKILFNEDAQTEYNIMKMLDISDHVVKTIEHIKINETIDVLVLEKCECSLQEELQKIQKERKFPRLKLYQMINQLIDGLIKLRFKNIIHLDIKPSNILITRQGDYVFSDFGISSVKKQQKIEIKGFTQGYASPEQIKAFHSHPSLSTETDYQSDIYSLGITFLKINECYERLKPDNKKFITQFKDIIRYDMLQQKPKDRKNCLELHLLILQKILGIGSLQMGTSLINLLDSLNILQKYSAQNINSSQKTIVNADTTCFENFFGYPFKTVGDYQNLLKSNLLSLNKIKQIPNPLSIYESYITVVQCSQIIDNLQNALDYYHEQLKIQQQIYSKNTTRNVKILSEISEFLRFSGYYQKAAEYTEKSVQMAKQIFVEDHIVIASTLHDAGQCYQSLGDNQKALEYLYQSLDMKRKLFKEDHHSITETLDIIGQCHLNLGQNKMALNFFLKSLEMTQSLIDKIRQIATFMNKKVNFYQNIGDNQKALDYLEKSLNDISQSLNNIGKYYLLRDDTSSFQIICWNLLKSEYIHLSTISWSQLQNYVKEISKNQQ
ncbi:tetratricopeptide repeat protein (macronuclear) [Tetrahymena thermophila SB210]|uniref:Tetratricopeptide repeat protein n=1 Tax=Tetrahymena thermophila (strain SB210) TaxID=312017 RepID=Q22SQ2_TETTS|nr:tetratricopeptide repeat protein [Tetrahymena thermophila SB210]EAR88323.2 tetratricopeptide repeat protein [Tetrahymena thermophila SB210]|eukprot:XP_001008568.2 tetratricopeptide repeat protein [Tetrahymena thermophila SB210]